MQIKGYNQLQYGEFLSLVWSKYTVLVDKGIKALDIAVQLEIGVDSVYKALQFKKQYVADKTLSLVMEVLGIKGMIVWINGERSYYILEEVTKVVSRKAELELI